MLGIFPTAAGNRSRSSVTLAILLLGFALESLVVEATGRRRPRTGAARAAAYRFSSWRRLRDGGREQGDPGRQSGRGPGGRDRSTTAARWSTCASPRSESWKDRDGNRQERTEWHNVVIFNENLGRVAKSYLKKGSKVYLEGQIQTRKWADQSGNDRYTTEVVLQRFRGELVLLDSRGRRRRRAAPSTKNSTTPERRPAAPNRGPSRRRSTPTWTTTFRSRSLSRPSLSWPAPRRGLLRLRSARPLP